MNLFFRLLVASLLTVAFACAAAADAARPARAKVPGEGDVLPVIAMQHTSWTARDGAPTNVKSIAQTPDGWLWLGGSSGLFRFDGLRFERVEGTLSSDIYALGTFDDGTLWLTYAYGGLSLLKDGRMRHYRAGEAGLPLSTIDGGLARDADGRVWLGGDDKLFVLGGDGAWYQADAALGAPSGVVGLLVGRDGTLWLRANGGVYALAHRAARFERRLALSGEGWLAEHPDGSIWASDSSASGLHLVAGAPGSDAGSWRSDDRVTRFTFDHAGNLWTPFVSGVVRWDAAGSADRSARRRSDAAHGLSGLHGFAVFEDREHDMWVATENGIDRFRDYRIRPLDLPPHPFAAPPLAAARSGGVWVDGFSIARPDALPVQYTPWIRGPAATSVLHEGPDGTLWSAATGRLWAFRNGERSDVPLPALPHGAVARFFSLTTDPDGTLWASLGLRGIYALRDGRWSARGGGVPGLEKIASTAAVAAGHEVLWVGSVDDRVTLRDHGKVLDFGRADGLRVGTVQAILPVPGGAWIGGENGLARFDGRRFAMVTGRGGEPFAGITGLVVARDGTLWVNGAGGLSALAPAELARAARDPTYRVRFDRLDYRDGLLGTARQQSPLPSAAAAKDGTLWFTTEGATFAFDPATLPRNGLAPTVLVTALKAGGKRFPAQDGLRLAPGTRALEVDFTALSLRAPERMAFRYQLEGVDPGWQEADGRRSVQYTNLAPGRYRFRVIASNDDGVWNERGATLIFDIVPTPTQTLWFRLLCGAAALLVLWLLHRMRLRSVARRMSMQMHAKVAERERIARELHDTLLSSIHGLVLKFDAALQGLRPGERAPLEDALARANRVLREGRDRVAGLRGEGAAPGALAEAIADYGAPLARDHGVALDVVTEGDAIALADGTAAEVLAIVREAVWNAFAHARATTVTVTLRGAPDALTVTVADDGCGMPVDVAEDGTRAGHWGVPGMRERAAGIGARLTLASRAGGGTEWTLVVPDGGGSGRRSGERAVDVAGA